MAPLGRNLLWAVVGILLVSASATAKVIYVSPTGNDLNDGSSWARAKRTVTAALDIAASRDEIWVRFGVYNERITLKSGVSLYGGFRGTESSLSERPTFPRPSSDPYETVLDGGGFPRVVATPSIASEPYRLDGFTVRNGCGNYPSAAVYLLGKAADYLTVANCRIVDSMPGQAFVCNGGSPYFENCSVENAAGIVCMNSSIALKGCVFKGAGNVSFVECTPALDGCLVEGGSMSFVDSQAVLYNCTYNMCGVSVFSSSVYLYYYYPSAALLVDRCRFWNGGVSGAAAWLYITNSRIEGGEGPAVLQSYPGEIVMENCIISGKRTDYAGAIEVNSGTFINCVISNNTGSYAGGVYVWDKATFINCTISQNTADRGNGNGGGVFVRGHATFTNCVISGNTAKEYGGGVCASANSRLTFVDCNIAQNQAATGGAVYLPATSAATFRGCVLSDNGDHGVYCAQYAAGIEMTGCTLQDSVYFAGLDSSRVATFDNCRMVYANIEGNLLLRLTNCFLDWTRVQGGKLHLTGCKARRSSIRASGELLLTDCSICDGESIISDGGQNVITRCVIANNYSRESGGGISIRYKYAGLEISDSIIAGNRSEGYGGGVYVSSVYSSLRARNCLIMGNRAAQAGGGVFSPYASLVNCSVLYNRASSGGGLASEGVGAFNCLIAFNEGGGILRVYASDDYWFRFNCVWQNSPYDVWVGRAVYDPTGRNGNISADPLIAGGHLLPGSPCIDAGDNSAVTTERDVDGEARIAGNRVDIGADEFHSPILQGRLFFNDRVEAMPGAVDIELRTTGMPEMRTVSVDPLGGFVIPHPPVDLLALSVKPLSYLRRTVEVDASGGDVLGVELDLVNGDIDDDNEVTLFDFGRLVAVFGAWGYDPLTYRADLDGDGEVTLFDFGILVRNFGEIGDE